MTQGRFKRFVHYHYFEPTSSGTRMRDILDFDSPWGVLGRIVDRLVLTTYLRHLLQERNTIVRTAAESGVQSRAAT